MLEGMLLINKPSGITSHDVVDVIRRKFGIRRVGHTGTLDPMAEGLLIVLVGPATTHQQAFQQHEKRYDATLKLGVQTDTGDRTGTAIKTAPIPDVEREHLARLLASFEGVCSQTPPAYSAVKVRGRPAYWWTRRQQPVTLVSRTIRLSECSLLASDETTVTFHVRCSAGTYIRTLGESIAERLGTVGHLTRLVRLGIGAWSLEQAKPLAWVRETQPEILADHLQSVGSCLPV